MRVLVCGGRSYGSFGKASPTHSEYAEAFNQRGIMCRALDYLKIKGMRVILHGGATGADAYCGRWAIDHDVSVEVFKADWRNAGRAAGPIRNQRMINEGKPDLVIAFPGGKGTADMVRRARAAAIEVREIS